MNDKTPTNAPARPAPGAEFLKPAFAKVQANLELLLGKAVAITTGEPAPVAAVDLERLVPPPCVVLGVQVSGAIDARLLCLLPERLALAMSALVQMKSESAMSERLADPAEMNATEQDGVREASSFIVAALGDFAKEGTGGRIVLAPAQPRFVPGDGADLDAGTDDWMVIEGVATIASAPKLKIVLAFPVSLVKVWSGPDAKAASVFGGGRARPAPAQPVERGDPPPRFAPVLWVSGGEALARKVAESVDHAFTLRGFATLPELLIAAESEPPPAVLVVEVASGSEFQLDLVAALRRHPSLSASGLVVALEHATRQHVVRCGSLGLVDVIPSGLELAALGEKLVTVSRAAKRRARAGVAKR